MIDIYSRDFQPIYMKAAFLDHKVHGIFNLSHLTQERALIEHEFEHLFKKPKSQVYESNFTEIKT